MPDRRTLGSRDQILPNFEPSPLLNGQTLTFYILSTLRHVTPRGLSTDPSPPLLVHVFIECPLSNIQNFKVHSKGGLISEGILTLVLLPPKSSKSLPFAGNLNKLFTEKGWKLKFSAQGRALAPFFGNGTKVKYLLGLSYVLYQF